MGIPNIERFCAIQNHPDYRDDYNAYVQAAINAIKQDQDGIAHGHCITAVRVIANGSSRIYGFSYYSYEREEFTKLLFNQLKEKFGPAKP